MPRRGLVAGAWALVTIAATLLAWVAVRQVTDEVSPRGVRPLPTFALAGPVATPDAADADPVRPTPTRPTPAATLTPTPTEPPTETAEPGVATPPAGEQQDPGPVAEPVTQAHELVGGAVTVRYRDGTTTLVTATPASGFRVDVHDAGPDKVEVRFRSDGHESRLVTRWRGGAPDPQIDERPR